MKRKTLIAALGCALLAISLLGCGGSNKLQSITLSIGNTSAGFFNLQGIGGTLQLQATGNYSNSKTHDLTNVVTYTIIVDPINNVDAFNNPLLAAPQTVKLSPTGLLTAVDPATCTWIDMEPDSTKSPSWLLSGDYEITATFGGITSQPIFVGVASSGGNPDNIFVNPPLINNNPKGLCGPTS